MIWAKENLRTRLTITFNRDSPVPFYRELSSMRDNSSEIDASARPDSSFIVYRGLQDEEYASNSRTCVDADIDLECIR
jgi:hypothetical protein